MWSPCTPTGVSALVKHPDRRQIVCLSLITKPSMLVRFRRATGVGSSMQPRRLVREDSGGIIHPHRGGAAALSRAWSRAVTPCPAPGHACPRFFVHPRRHWMMAPIADGATKRVDVNHPFPCSGASVRFRRRPASKPHGGPPQSFSSTEATWR